MVNINVYADDTLFPFIEGAMLEGRDVVRVIRGVRAEEVSDPRTGGGLKKLALVFHGTGKKLLLNKTNASRLAKLYGPDTDAWRDQPVTLYAEETKAFGQMRLTVRVREQRPAMPTDVAERLKPVSDEEAQGILNGVSGA